jgi:hypothetical protein
MKLAIIGSRGFSDYELLCNELADKKDKIHCIVSGGARGADSLGERWANENGKQKIIYKAEWDRYGKKAGYLRNELIVRDSDAVIAFWDGISKGTKHSIDLCSKLDKPLKIIRYENNK